MNFETPLTSLVWLTSLVSVALTFIISYLIIARAGRRLPLVEATGSCHCWLYRGSIDHFCNSRCYFIEVRRFLCFVTNKLSFPESVEGRRAAGWALCISLMIFCLMAAVIAIPKTF